MLSNQEMVTIVVLDGSTAMEEQYPPSSITEANGWEECTVPHMLGIPLMAKPIRSYQTGHLPRNQPAVFMMVEPVTGLAPMRWQLGPHCNRGMIGFGRRDGQPLTCVQWAALHGYIYDLMDEYSDALVLSDDNELGLEEDRVVDIIKNRLHPEAFRLSPYYVHFP